MEGTVGNRVVDCKTWAGMDDECTRSLFSKTRGISTANAPCRETSREKVIYVNASCDVNVTQVMGKRDRELPSIFGCW